MPTPASAVQGSPPVAAALSQPRGRFSGAGRWACVALLLGALVFLFPFYYMVIGALQREPNSDISGAFPDPGNLTLANFADINAQVDLVRTLINSGIFTGGVLLATLFIGLLAGYALAQLEFRGRSVVFGFMMLILVLPFQLFMIPLYVLIVRSYGLADNYLGMILPFAVNATAVFIFRQFFLQLPRDLFDSARIDGASELGDPAPDRHPAGEARHRHGDDRHLHRAVERVPVAVPDHQAARPAAARRGAGELHLDRRRAGGEPVRVHPCRRGRAASSRRSSSSSSSSASSSSRTSARRSRDERCRSPSADGASPGARRRAIPSRSAWSVSVC